MSERVLLAHGGGGGLARQLILNEVLPALTNPALAPLADAAVVEGAPRLAFTTDAYVVTPAFFPGGDIGRLAVCGTVNDLAVTGARPLYLSLAAILEEGFPLADLRLILSSVKQAALEAGVAVVTGDTKVVERGAADGVFLTSAGVGSLGHLPPGWGAPEPGDALLVNGTLGDHGFTILAAREGLTFEHPLKSDAAPLNGLVFALLEAEVRVRLMRDLTRGGLGAALNEWVSGRPWGFEVQESQLPFSPGVRSLAELLGLDPIFSANEGKLLAIVHPDDANRALELMQDHPLGRDAAVIGRVTEANPGLVVTETPFGSRRILDQPAGDPLPRIC